MSKFLVLIIYVLYVQVVLKCVLKFVIITVRYHGFSLCHVVS